MVGLGVDLRELLPAVVARRDVRRADDLAVLVDPDGGRDVHHAEALRQHPLAVDDHRVRGVRLVDPRSDGVDVLVERDREDPEVLLPQLVLQRLPRAELVPTAAPRGPGDDHALLAGEVAEAHLVPVQVGQREVRGVPRARGVVGDGRRRSAEHGDPLVGVDGDHQPHGGAEPFEVHQTVDHQVRGAPHGHAHVALAQPRVLQLPPRGRAQIVDRNEQPISVSPPSDPGLRRGDDDEIDRLHETNLREDPAGCGGRASWRSPHRRGVARHPERQAVSAPEGARQLVGGGRRPPTTKTTRAAALARPRRGWRGRSACCRRCRARRTRPRPVPPASAPWPTRC